MIFYSFTDINKINWTINADNISSIWEKDSYSVETLCNIKNSVIQMVSGEKLIVRMTKDELLADIKKQLYECK